MDSHVIIAFLANGVEDELQEEYLVVVKYDVKSYGELFRLKQRLQQVDEKQKVEKFIEEKTERIIGVMKLLGLDAGNLAGCSTDVLSKVFNLGDIAYFTGMKLFNRVIDRLSINMDRQRCYEVFDRIYEEGMREKKVERDRNNR